MGMWSCEDTLAVGGSTITTTGARPPPPSPHLSPLSITRMPIVAPLSIRAPGASRVELQDAILGIGAEDGTPKSVQRSIAQCVAAVCIDGGDAQVKSTVDGILGKVKVRVFACAFEHLYAASLSAPLSSMIFPCCTAKRGQCPVVGFTGCGFVTKGLW